MNRRFLSALVAAGAAAALVMLGPGPSAAAPPQAAASGGGTDQVTGNGVTASAVTVTWAQGLVGSDNKTVVATRDPNSPLAFMYPDFQNLKVTVSQTSNLVHQSIQVTWTGGTPTAGLFQGNFLQMMQCYGDAATGPTPEQCEYGSPGLLAGATGNAVVNPGIGSRRGQLCTVGAVASVTSPPGTADGSVANNGCDTLERADPTHVESGDTTDYSIPFVPVTDPSTRLYSDHLSDAFNQFTSNEVQEANTNTDGSGKQFFQTLTAVEAPGLGCGALTAGKPRDCWLVIVPRGQYKPNGWKINTGLTTGSPNFLTDSPLGASNWAQRIQIHLTFDPLQPNCPIGAATEREMVGTQLIARAVYSWQLALNQTSNCKTLYGFSATPEPTDTAQLADSSGTTAGLAFTTIPIGSEAIRNGTKPPKLPKLVYAPVSASAITFAFNINAKSGFVTEPIKLTPRLVAKALTQSYRFDLPTVDSNHAGPDWARNNPNFITTDPEFRKLNPGIDTPPSGSPLAPLLTEDHSGVNEQVWQWVLGDAAARSWLSGKADEFGMVVNPAYRALKLQDAAVDSFPRADGDCLDLGELGSPPKDAVRCSLNLLPYVHNYDDAAIHVRTGNNPEGASWDSTKQAPDGTAGWWGNGGIEPAGQVFMWSVTDSASLASYGLVPADLCNADGTKCVAPNTASVTTSLSSATADSTGLLHVNAAKPGSGGYPLVTVTYAAVRTTLPADAKRDFGTFIKFVANDGQVAGDLPGQLPHGYLPLPKKLRTQATKIATQLGATATPGGTQTSNGGGSGSSGGTGALPTPLPSESSTDGPVIVAGPVPAAAVTKATDVGAIRWALVAMVCVGLTGAAGVPVLRSRWLLRAWEKRAGRRS